MWKPRIPARIWKKTVGRLPVARLPQNRAGDEIAPPAIEAYRRTLATLPRFQIEAGRNLNYKVCYPRASFDRQSIAWDLNYFKYYFLRLAGIPFNEQALEQDFTRLTKFLLTAPHDYFLYRDFQSRNIMLKNGQPFFLDYQGGRKGALQYDVASLLYDAKADLPSSVRQELLDHYLDVLPDSLSLIEARSCFITMRTFMCASCRPSERMDFAASMNASSTFCKACLTH
jgi:aminoglycoside/choline kinase family phosphotransferase